MYDKYLNLTLAGNALDGFDFDQQMEFVFKKVDREQWLEAAICLITSYADGVYKIKECVHYNDPIVQEAIQLMRTDAKKAAQIVMARNV